MTARIPLLTDSEALARRLESEPLAIGDPDVLEQLRHLKAFANFEELSGDLLEQLLATEDGVAYFNSMMHTGRAVLQKVLDGFVRGMLPTVGAHAGFSVQPVKLPRRRGRKASPGRQWEEARLMKAFCWLRTRLEGLERGKPLLWKRRREETLETLVERTALEVVQRIHTDAWLRERHPFVDRWLSEYRLDAEGNIVGLLHPSERPMLAEPLPADAARCITRQVLRKRVDKNRLL